MDKTYTFNLNEQQVQTIITALQEMPLKHSLDTFMTLQRQAAQQLQEVAQSENVDD